MSDVKQPVKAMDPLTNHYGQQKTEALRSTTTSAFRNTHANLHASKADRMKAMARRSGKMTSDEC